MDAPLLSPEPNDGDPGDLLHAITGPAARDCRLCGISLRHDEAGICGECEEIPA